MNKWWPNNLVFTCVRPFADSKYYIKILSRENKILAFYDYLTVQEVPKGLRQFLVMYRHRTPYDAARCNTRKLALILIKGLRERYKKMLKSREETSRRIRQSL